MRLMQICLIAVVMMPPNHFAFAETRASCASEAQNLANTNVKDVELWLSRYRQAYAGCVAEHEVNDAASPSASERNGSLSQELGIKSTKKSANPKAVFRNSVVKQMVKPIPKPLDISKTEDRPSASTRKRKNVTRAKKAIETKTVIVKKPSPVSFSTSTDVQRMKPVKSVGVEGWRVNCSPRFGGWDKVSDWYVAGNGKRVSCATRP